MKRNDITALHDKTVAELHAQLRELQVQLAKAKLKKYAGKLENISSLKEMRDDIARIKTVMREKELLDFAVEAVKQTASKTNTEEAEKVEKEA